LGGESPLAELLGAGLKVPVYEGGLRTYHDLDAAATTPPLRSVWDAVAESMLLYGSIHRGAGYKSVLSTARFESARDAVIRFAGGTPDRDVLVLAANTTTAANALARRLGLQAEDVVVTSEIEHSSNLLPWRKAARVIEYRIGADGALDVDDLQRKVSLYRPKIVAVTAASNVTGALVDVHAAARVAHEGGARVFVDAAQLVAHRRVDRRAPSAAEHLDFVAFAGHKMYAPFGLGVVLGPREVFETGWPDNPGGGTLTLIDGSFVVWNDLPEREIGGTPNYVGLVAMAQACRALETIGFDAIREHEVALACHFRSRMESVEGFSLHRALDDLEGGLAVFPFTMDGFHPALVASYLGVERAVGVRAGHLCQYELVRRLLRVPADVQASVRAEVAAGDRRRLYGVVRASTSIGTTIADLDALFESLAELRARGPRATYEQALDGHFMVPGWPATLEFSARPDRRPFA
jgi:selenocysteine lyase/cysteine desulfurase